MTALANIPGGNAVFPVTTHFVAFVPVDVPRWDLQAGDPILCQMEDHWSCDDRYLTRDGRLVAISLSSVKGGRCLSWPDGRTENIPARAADDLILARVKGTMRGQGRSDYITRLTEEAFCGGLSRMSDAELERFIARLVAVQILTTPSALDAIRAREAEASEAARR